MSHITTIDTIIFQDIAALKQAVAELNKEGIRCELLIDTAPRSYEKNIPSCPYCLKLLDGQYDVGFRWDDKARGYKAEFDPYRMYISSILGASPKIVDDIILKYSRDSQNGVTNREGVYAAITKSHIAKLTQKYAVSATMRQAAQKGLSVRKMISQNGDIKLVLTGFAS